MFNETISFLTAANGVSMQYVWRFLSKEPEISRILDQLWHVDCCSTVSVSVVGHGRAVILIYFLIAISIVAFSSVFIQPKAGQALLQLVNSSFAVHDSKDGCFILGSKVSLMILLV